MLLIESWEILLVRRALSLPTHVSGSSQQVTAEKSQHSLVEGGSSPDCRLHGHGEGRGGLLAQGGVILIVTHSGLNVTALSCDAHKQYDEASYWGGGGGGLIR